jgi:hypothetical protein
VAAALHSKRRSRPCSPISSWTYNRKLLSALELASDWQIRRNASQLGEQLGGIRVTAAATAPLSDGHASPGCCCRCVGSSSLTTLGGIGGCSGRTARYSDDEKKFSASATIPLNKITFQRTQQITPPPSGLCFFGPGLVSSVTDVYAAVVADLPFIPGLHVNYGETTLHIRDGLMKLKDFPKEFGGSGIELAE